MEKKKLKLSISGKSKKTFNSIEQARSQSKNTVLIERKTGRVQKKQPFQKFNRASTIEKKPKPIIDKKNFNNFD